MKKKLVSVLLVAAMTVSMLAGCGAKSDSEKGSSASADGDVTITYWGWDSNYYEPMFAAYEKEHPNVHFEPTAVEWGDMLTKAQQALASGSDLPVMFGMDNTLIENWKAMDICEDLTKYDFDDSKYLDSLAEKCKTDDGKIIGVQESINPAGIAYKRDLAKEYFGTDDPAELQAMFASYDDYAAKGSEVYDKSNGEVHLFHSGQAVAEWLYFASDVANMDGDTLTYTDKMTDVLSKLVTLRDANAVDTYQSGTPEANATYADDKHIFYPCPNWALTYYIQGNDPDGSGNWGLLRAPVDYNHGGAALGISSSATDEQKQAAYDFAVWATAGDGATIARDDVGYITPYLDLMNDPHWVSMSEDMIAWFGGQDIGEVYYQEIAPNMAGVPSTAWDNTIVNVRNDLSQQLMDDTAMTLDAAIKLGDDQIKQLVTDDSVTVK
ncbi:MAG: extracellular solute-binding protein [Hespellia sp.]|nr:extracellular solute-binding protein [Hespellia sp.]